MEIGKGQQRLLTCTDGRHRERMALRWARMSSAVKLSVRVARQSGRVQEHLKLLAVHVL